MKVLLCAPDDQHTSLYVKRAFQKLGHEVRQFDYRQYPLALPLSQNQMFSSSDLVLILKGETFKPEELRDVQPPCFLWNFDLWYHDEPWLQEQIRAVDHFFTPSKGLFEGDNVHYLPEAADPELHRPVYDVPKTMDVTFIGTVKDVPERDEWLAKVGEWCDDNKKTFYIFGSFPGELSKKWHAGVRAGPEFYSGTEDEVHNRIVSSSHVCLDRQRNPEIEGAISARVFRTLAARGFLLARRSAGMEKLFTPGWDLLTYKDDEECLKLLDATLGETVNPFDKNFVTDHSVERRVMGRHGWETVMAKHLWEHRVEELLKLL